MRILWPALVLLVAGCTATPAALDVAPTTTSTPTIAPASTTSPADASAPAPEPIVLGRPVPLNPSGGVRLSNLDNVYFTWERPSYNGREVVTIAAVVDGVEVCRTSEARATTCWGPVPKGPSSRLWRPVATTPSGLRSEGSLASFTTNTPPPPPTLLSPTAGSHSSLETTTFTLAPVIDPDGDIVTYRVEVRDLDRSRTTTASCTLTTCTAQLQLATRYEATPLASDAAETMRGAAVAFRTNAPPLAVVLDAGDDGAEQVPLNGAWSWARPTAQDPDGDNVRYYIAYTEADGMGRLAPCTVGARIECRLNLAKFGHTYGLTVVAEDAIGSQTTTMLSATTRLPVIILHGWNSDIRALETMRDNLQAHGFDARSIGYGPSDGITSIEALATRSAWPAVATTLSDYPPDQRFDIVAHSMGGLVSRYLLEDPDHETNSWVGRVDRLVMIGTPNHGAKAGWSDSVCAVWIGAWRDSCGQMVPNSPFLAKLNDGKGTGAAYYTIAGRGYYTFHPEDDGVVESESVAIPNAVRNIVRTGSCHGENPWTNCDKARSLMEVQATIDDVLALLSLL